MEVGVTNLEAGVAKLEAVVAGLEAAITKLLAKMAAGSVAKLDVISATLVAHARECPN